MSSIIGIGFPYSILYSNKPLKEVNEITIIGHISLINVVPLQNYGFDIIHSDVGGNRLYISSYLYTSEMAKPIQDDFNGSILSEEDDTVYTLTVTKRGVDAEGNRQLLKLDLDLGSESMQELIFGKFEPKVLMNRWQKYLPPSETEKASGKKGTWVKAKK